MATRLATQALIVWLAEVTPLSLVPAYLNHSIPNAVWNPLWSLGDAQLTCWTVGIETARSSVPLAFLDAIAIDVQAGVLCGALRAVEATAYHAA